MSTSIFYICTPIRQAQRKQHSTAEDNNSSCVHSCLCSTVAAAGPDAAALTLSCRYASACRHGCMKRPTASSSPYIMDDWCFSASKRSPPGANSCKQQQQKPQPELSWSPACCCWYTHTCCRCCCLPFQHHTKCARHELAAHMCFSTCCTDNARAALALVPAANQWNCLKATCTSTLPAPGTHALGLQRQPAAR